MNAKFSNESAEQSVVGWNSFDSSSEDLSDGSDDIDDIDVDDSQVDRCEGEDHHEWHKRLSAIILKAAEKGIVSVVDKCLRLRPDCVRAVDSDCYTPLHRSSYNNHIQVMRHLLKYGADVSARTSDGWTPLHCAAKWGHIEAVDLLLNCGADINAVSNGGNTALHLAANYNKRPLLELLLYNEDIDVDIKNQSGETAYQIAKRSSPLYQLWNYL